MKILRPVIIINFTSREEVNDNFIKYFIVLPKYLKNIFKYIKFADGKFIEYDLINDSTREHDDVGLIQKDFITAKVILRGSEEDFKIDTKFRIICNIDINSQNSIDDFFEFCLKKAKHQDADLRNAESHTIFEIVDKNGKINNDSVEKFVLRFYDLNNSKQINWQIFQRIWLFSNKNSDGIYLSNSNIISTLIYDFVCMFMESEDRFLNNLNNSQDGDYYATIGYAVYKLNYKDYLQYLCLLQLNKELKFLIDIYKNKFDRVEVIGGIRKYINNDKSDCQLSQIDKLLLVDPSGQKYFDELNLDFNCEIINYDEQVRDLLGYYTVQDKLLFNKINNEYVKHINEEIGKYERNKLPDLFEYIPPKTTRVIKDKILKDLNNYINTLIDDPKFSFNYSILFLSEFINDITDTVIDDKNATWTELYSEFGQTYEKQVGLDELYFKYRKPFINSDAINKEKDGIMKELEKYQKINTNNKNELKSIIPNPPLNNNTENNKNDIPEIKNQNDFNVKLQAEISATELKVNELYIKIKEKDDFILTMNRKFIENRNGIIDEKLDHYTLAKNKKEEGINKNIEIVDQIIENKNNILYTKSHWVKFNLIIQPIILVLILGVLYYIGSDFGLGLFSLLFISQQFIFRLFLSIFLIFISVKLIQFYLIYYSNISKLNKEILVYANANELLLIEIIKNQQQLYIEKHRFVRLGLAYDLVNSIKNYSREKRSRIVSLRNAILPFNESQSRKLDDFKLDISEFNKSILTKEELKYYFENNFNSQLLGDDQKYIDWKLSEFDLGVKFDPLIDKVNKYVLKNHEKEFMDMKVEDIINNIHKNKFENIEKKENIDLILESFSNPLFEIGLQDESENHAVGFRKKGEESLLKDRYDVYGKLKLFTSIKSKSVLENLSIDTTKFDELIERLNSEEYQ